MMSQESGSSDGIVSFECGQILESSEDDQITEALEEYVKLRREGRPLPRQDFLARHPSIAVALDECLDGLELVEDAANHFTSRQPVGVSASDLSPPAQLGEFRLVREIGRGGMGVVFEAEQVSLGRRVALKVLPAAASLDSRHRRRFQAEAQAAGLLHHEHIVPVFGTGFDAGVHYYVMQFIDGNPLTEVLRELKSTAARQNAQAVEIDLPQLALAVVGSGLRRSRTRPSSSAVRQHCHSAVRWAVQAADALEHAHEIGVIHRDIKPANLLIDRRGRLWVTDFGPARLPADNYDLTHTGDLVGTLRYMSPEQLGGGRGSADARTDIYALGVTLYELLTLQPAHSGRDRQELRAHILRHEPAPPRRLNPSIARDLETVVMKAIEKDPSARYASAREFAADLRRILADQPVRASRPGVMRRAVKWSSRHQPAVVASASVLVLSLVAGMIVLWEAKGRDEATLLEFRRLRVQERLARENALGAIDQAVDWDAERSDAWRSLGMTCYRAGDWKSASSSLRQAMELDHGGNAADWFLMAAIDHHLGKHTDAQHWYDGAISRLTEPSSAERTGGIELRRSRAEALEALGMPVPESYNRPRARVIEAMNVALPPEPPSLDGPAARSPERPAP
jgi:eukaryotic-like serine/threonine-protein kinase